MFKEVSMPDATITDQSKRPNSNAKTINRLALVALAALTFTQSVGCNFNKLAVKDAVMISYRDMVWAKRAYNLRFGNCDRAYAEHFQAGFCAGYADLCNGGDGYVPAMPPQEYRSYEFQCAEGAQCVNSWFEGYPEGVAAARKDKVGKFHDVMISRMIDSAVSQENAEHKLPADVPVVSASSQPKAPAIPTGYQQPSRFPSFMSNPQAYDNAEVPADVSYPPITRNQDYSVPAPPIVMGSGLISNSEFAPGMADVNEGSPLPFGIKSSRDSNRRNQ